MAPARRQSTLLVLALAAVAFGLVPLLLGASGASAPAWSHFWCSPASLRSASRIAGGGLGGALSTLMAAFEVHWPHLLPILAGLATLVYLQRADARYRIQRAHAQYRTQDGESAVG